jgi:hypothetical protein
MPSLSNQCRVTIKHACLKAADPLPTNVGNLLRPIAMAASFVAYDTAAWSLSDGMVPRAPLCAPRAARIAAHATTCFVDAVRVFGALTHFEHAPVALVEHGWAPAAPSAEDIDAHALLATDRAGCSPWLALALFHGALSVGPLRRPALLTCFSTVQTPCWLLVHHTVDNKRCIMEILDAHIAAVHSVVTGAPKPTSELLDARVEIPCEPHTGSHQPLLVHTTTESVRVLVIARGVALAKRELAT